MNRATWLKVRHTPHNILALRGQTLYPHDKKTADPKTGKQSPAVKVFDSHSGEYIYMPLFAYKAHLRAQATEGRANA